MVETFNTKRPHRKSRGGCSTCKAKKIKCDEAQPKCNFCAARNLTCHYGIRPTTPKPTPPGSSQSLVAMTPKNSPPSIDFCKTMGNVSPSITSMPGVSSIEDLRLMHHYSTFVWNSVSLGDFSDTNDVLRITTPQLAFEYDFLMKTLLAFSSAHRRRLLPGSEPARLQTSIYHAQALSSFRRVVGQVKSDSPNYQAVLMVALLLSILTCTDDRKEGDELVIIEVLGLWRGLSNLMMITTPSFIETIPIFPIFRREFSPLKLEPIVPTELIQMLAAINPSDPEFHDLEHYCKALDAMGRVGTKIARTASRDILSIDSTIISAKDASKATSKPRREGDQFQNYHCAVAFFHIGESFRLQSEEARLGLGKATKRKKFGSEVGVKTGLLDFRSEESVVRITSSGDDVAAMVDPLEGHLLTSGKGFFNGYLSGSITSS
ncbi:hypothetical protein B7494_g831 [Chlorociboria aeruginascens]|nr:hypothetical protein B7494_g831 [Chlorociboria aeruginascens]